MLGESSFVFTPQIKTASSSNSSSLCVGGAVEGGSRLHGAASAADVRGRRAASGPKNHQRVQNLHQEGKHGRAVNLQADPRRRPTRLQHRAWWETGHRVSWRDVSSKGPFEDPRTTHEQSSPSCRQALWVRVHRGNLQGFKNHMRTQSVGA